MRLTAIAAADLPRVWPTAEPWLAQACARPGDHGITAKGLLAACAQEQALLILIGPPGEPVAAVVSQVIVEGGGTLSCWLLALGGSRWREWQHLMAEIEAGARRMGCRTVEFIGRPAWRRVFPDYATAPVPAGIHFLKFLAS
ncbi:hypothetical protein [uncultured Methylobacterium sp.]|jgi:hypothetical protein|uniref:hypothetical protein n=1 Tax=uncultured Methylobacterium sp. TaxID=157278 RepID=UPI0026350DF3|nr:hypothetical protein [uncultured Methylobacterium sp.]